MKSGSLVVRHHSPLQRIIIWAVGILLLVASGYGLYFFGNHRAGFDATDAIIREEGLKSAISELERQNTDLRDRVALLDRSTQMDQQAYLDVNSNLRSLQEEVLELREEVAFYRGIVSPDEAASGLRVERIAFAKSGSNERLYHYQMVLTQVLKQQGNATGVVVFKVHGTQAGRARTLAQEEISLRRESSQSFKFRYFQKMEGDVILPEGFTPRTIDVSMNGGRGKSVTQSFAWDVAVKGSLDKSVEQEVN
ncbi:MAG: hypothetical protein OEW58_11640 [Gammaproteobacteria bacterium]|nr:hypothetical protein [Gammaproteobacteria bacterium]